jgi:hypothetical protein
MKLRDWRWRTIHHTLAILCEIRTLEQHSPKQRKDVRYSMSSTMEATLCRNDWKQVPMFLPVNEHFSFHIPAAAPGYQRHRR